MFPQFTLTELYEKILAILKSINEHYSNLLLVILGIISALTAYHEFSISRTPIVIPYVQCVIDNKGLTLLIYPENAGPNPAYATINNLVLKGIEIEKTRGAPAEVIIVPKEFRYPLIWTPLNPDELSKAINTNESLKLSMDIESRDLITQRRKYKHSFIWSVTASGGLCFGNVEYQN